MRLFVAMDIPEDVRSAIGGFVAKLRSACRNARWVRIEGLHVTLKFIGETAAENAERIKTALAAIPGRAPISMNFRGLGFFPNERRPRVLWAGIEADPELAALAAEVGTALHPIGVGRENREFSPHLTLARFETPRGLDALHTAIDKAGPYEFGGVTAKQFHLYQSVLKPGGAEYTRLATFSFAGTIAETITRRRPE
ncbi:MAG TPA: RNA 2',3'-cyclic phosphodiesterase [Candidatus Acidoferrales bacterium]|jgi:2'-5' RNA ligase|nr:RNA 2',3'-cyclic phosphodiesterase [Candidatus Acidoferrales bacterium]